VTTDPGPLAADVDAYSAALRPALRESSYDRWRESDHATTEARIADHAELLALLHADGWNRFGWPAEAGGHGGDERHRAALYDELSAAGLPVPEPVLMLETLGPPMIKFAPDLAAAHLPAYLRGEEWWGQGFSEPEAGSDLASLRCRARRDGDSFVVSGSKLWTSHGATATRLVCLVRTGTPESRHRGLSMLMIDVASPGVTVRPVALASGQNELAEVFFDDVVVPASHLVGEQDGGWGVAMYLLQFERAMYAWMCAAVGTRRLGDLRDALAAGPLQDGIRLRLGQCYTDLVNVRARSSRTVARLAAGEPVGPEASVDKILLATFETSLYDLARDGLGSDFLSAPQARAWRDEWWYSRSATILGGSSEVQRTIIADHVLGLPKEGS
jgi:hypothetical protein